MANDSGGPLRCSRPLSILVALAIVLAACGSDSDASSPSLIDQDAGASVVSTSEDNTVQNRQDLSEVETFRQLLDAFPEATDPRGHECAGVPRDPGWPPTEGNLLADYVKASVLRLDLDSPDIIAVLTAEEFIERRPQEADDLYLSEDQRIEFITVDAPSLAGRSLLIDRAALRAAADVLAAEPDASIFLTTVGPFESEAYIHSASIVAVGDRFNHLYRCWVGSFDKLFDDAVIEAASRTSSSADLYQDMMDANGESALGDAIDVLVEPVAEADKPEVEAEALLGFGFEPDDPTQQEAGRRTLIQVTLPKEWQGLRGESTYSICFRTEFGVHDCIATDAPVGADAQDDPFVTGYVFVPESGAEIWVDRYSENDQGPKLKLSSFDVSDVDTSVLSDGVMPIVQINIPAFVANPERDIESIRNMPQGLDLEVLNP